MSDTNTQPNSFTDKKNIMWVLLSGAMAAMFIVLLFVPGGSDANSTLSVYAAMLWCGIFLATVFRYINKNGWVGFIIGSVLGMLIQMLSVMFV